MLYVSKYYQTDKIIRKIKKTYVVMKRCLYMFMQTLKLNIGHGKFSHTIEIGNGKGILNNKLSKLINISILIYQLP